MSQATLASYFGGRGQKRNRAAESVSEPAKLEPIASASAAQTDGGVASKQATLAPWAAVPLPEGTVPAPSADELARICSCFESVSSLKEFSDILASAQPDFSGRLSGLSRALEWDGAPCNEETFLSE